jgi:uncharacterized protein YdhG (YjbR/CyaY superfamily)
MESKAKTAEEYIDALPDERKSVIKQLRTVLLNNLPEGFAEVMNYGMLGYVVPHTLYPNGYHCDRKLPLPFINVASQKNFIALYHIGIYADEELLKWFQEEYSKHCSSKLDMGKGCIRFKKPDQIPYDLIAELARKKTPQEWIAQYEKKLNR